MGIIKTAKLVYKYIKHSEEEDIEEVNRAINGLDVDIRKGDFMTVPGHDGSGKPTFAKHISGLLMPTEGTVWVSNMGTRDEEHLWDVRKTAGVVFQNPGNQIIGNIVEEDVGSGLENMNVPTEEIWRRVEESLKAVGMTAFCLQSPNKPSGSQKQRVTIAGMMAMKPQCIILDGPTTILDPSDRREIIRTAHELNRVEGITVLLITHYMEEATEADRIIVMDEGKIVMDGRPREIFSRVRELEEHGLSVPRVAELTYELKEAEMPLSNDILTRKQLVKGLAPLIRQAQEAFRYWTLE